MVCSKAMVGSAGLSARDLGQVRFGQAQVALDLRALVRRPTVAFRLQAGDLGGDLADVILDALEAFPDHGLAGDLVRDDLRTG